MNVLDNPLDDLERVKAVASRELSHTVNNESVLSVLLWVGPLVDEVIRLRAENAEKAAKIAHLTALVAEHKEDAAPRRE